MTKKTGGDSTSLVAADPTDIERAWKKARTRAVGKLEKELEALGDITYGFEKWESLEVGAKQRILQYLSHRYNFDHYLNEEGEQDGQ